LLFNLLLQGIEEIAGQCDLSEYEMIEIANPDLLSIKGVHKDVDFEVCKDFSYLHSLYVIKITVVKIMHIVTSLFCTLLLRKFAENVMDTDFSKQSSCHPPEPINTTDLTDCDLPLLILHALFYWLTGRQHCVDFIRYLW